jgi:hypothetical protein
MDDVCIYCERPIEEGSGTWWVLGTCASNCPQSRTGLHEPHRPDMSDREAVERWLAS